MLTIPVVVLSCHTTGLGIIRALGSMGVPVIVVQYNNSDMGQASKFVKEIILSPHPEKSPIQFLENLVVCAKKYPQSLLIPADDETLQIVSRNKKDLSHYFTVTCTDWAITELFLDKRKTYALAETAGVPAARTYVPKSVDDLKAYGRGIEFPCLVKPCFSHKYFELFRKKMVIVNGMDQMLAAYLEASSAGVEVMVQEFIPGDDRQGVNYNSYFVNGTPLVEFTALKIRLSPPFIGVPSVVVSGNVPEVLDLGRKILGAMNYEGYSCTEFKRDARDGVFKLMEVNGRHNRSTSLAIQCGINFPWIQYRHLSGGEIPGHCTARSGVYWIDEFKDIPKIFGGELVRSASYSKFFVPYLHPHVFSVFNWSDPLPFLKRCSDGVKIAAQHLCTILGRKTDSGFRIGKDTTI
jgi:predicted ATP-grasp superfamily ATP-dependent carboligase